MTLRSFKMLPETLVVNPSFQSQETTLIFSPLAVAHPSLHHFYSHFSCLQKESPDYYKHQAIALLPQ